MREVISVVGDAFGAGLLEQRRALGRLAVPEIVERDDGFVDASLSFARYFEEFDKWETYEQKAVEGIGGRILDVGAGAGRVAIHLQRAGNDVVALDTSAGAVRVCRNRGVKSTFCGDVAAYESMQPEPFDVFVLFGHNLGLLGGREASKRFLHSLYKLSRPNSVLIATGLDSQVWFRPDDVSYRERNISTERLPGQMRMRVRHRALATPWFDYLLTSPSELSELLVGTHWEINEVDDSHGASFAVRLSLAKDV